MDKLEIINFSHNWNKKLDCTAFTTIRLENNLKYKKGSVYEIHLKKVLHKKAMILEIKTMYLNDINEYIANLDTGYSSPETKEILLKMYPTVDFNKKKLMFILLKSVSCQ